MGHAFLHVSEVNFMILELKTASKTDLGHNIFQHETLFFREDPPNLSISISGGKKSNSDFFSSGE